MLGGETLLITIKTGYFVNRIRESLIYTYMQIFLMCLSVKGKKITKYPRRKCYQQFLSSFLTDSSFERLLI